MAIKGNQTHKFKSKDENAKTGVCFICGPVRIYRWRGYWQCETVYRAAKSRDANYSRNLRYGVTKEQYESMLKTQAGKCAICKRETNLHVDHDHDTGEVRGLLCGKCNRGIGLLNHDPKLLRKAVLYLG